MVPVRYLAPTRIPPVGDPETSNHETSDIMLQYSCWKITIEFSNVSDFPLVVFSGFLCRLCALFFGPQNTLYPSPASHDFRQLAWAIPRWTPPPQNGCSIPSTGSSCRTMNMNILRDVCIPHFLAKPTSSNNLCLISPIYTHIYPLVLVKSPLIECWLHSCTSKCPLRNYPNKISDNIPNKITIPQLFFELFLTYFFNVVTYTIPCYPSMISPWISPRTSQRPCSACPGGSYRYSSGDQPQRPGQIRIVGSFINIKPKWKDSSAPRNFQKP